MFQTKGLVYDMHDVQFYDVNCIYSLFVVISWFHRTEPLCEFLWPVWVWAQLCHVWGEWRARLFVTKTHYATFRDITIRNMTNVTLFMTSLDIHFHSEKTVRKNFVLKPTKCISLLLFFSILWIWKLHLKIFIKFVNNIHFISNIHHKKQFYNIYQYATKILQENVKAKQTWAFSACFGSLF